MPLRRLMRCAMQSGRERIEAPCVVHGIGTGDQESPGNVGQSQAAVCAGLFEASGKAALQIEQVLPLSGKTFCRMLEAACQPVELLASLVDFMFDLAA